MQAWLRLFSSHKVTGHLRCWESAAAIKKSVLHCKRPRSIKAMALSSRLLSKELSHVLRNAAPIAGLPSLPVASLVPEACSLNGVTTTTFFTQKNTSWLSSQRRSFSELIQNQHGCVQMSSCSSSSTRDTLAWI